MITDTHLYLVEHDISHFAEAPMKKYKAVGEIPGLEDHVDLTHKVGNFFGILMNEVVNIDLTRAHLNFSKEEAQVGSRVGVLRKGKLVAKFAKSLKLPIGQPIYVDMRTSDLTWKYGRIRVGSVINRQDNHGHCVIEFGYYI